MSELFGKASVPHRQINVGVIPDDWYKMNRCRPTIYDLDTTRFLFFYKVPGERDTVWPLTTTCTSPRE